MVCPNCQSTEIIKVQDQFFCTTCGQLVPSPEGELPDTRGLPAGVVIKPLGKDAKPKRRPGRPKAGRLDTPPPADEASPSPPHRHAIHDITPAAATTPPAVPIPAAPAGYGELVVAGTSSRFHWRYLLLMALPAALLALLAGGVYLVLARLSPAAALAATWQASWVVGGEIILVLVLYYLTRSIAYAAIIYGAARRGDHRPVPVSRWLGVAVNGFWGRLGFDVVIWLIQAALAGLIVVLVLTGGTPWPVPPLVQLGALFLGFLILLYALVGVALSQGFGWVALTLGTVSPGRAFGIGWIFFRHHFDLVAVKLVSLVIEVCFVVPLAAAVAALTIYVPHSLVWLSAGGAALAVAIGGALYGAGDAIWWETAYRRLVRHERLAEALTLLSGRQAERVDRGHLVFLAGLGLIIAAAAAAWPWVSWIQP